MAALRAPSASFLAAFLPVARERLVHETVTRRIPLLQQIQQLRINATLSPLLPAALAPIPSLLGQLWEGVLRAVPKKKTSHMKKRHRQMAGKALKDVTALNKCSACGRTKRAHVLCPYCVNSIKQWFANGFKSKQEVEELEQKRFEELNDSLRARGRRPLNWDNLYDEKKTKAEAK
ncbi:putative 54S ribosomal protein L32, mitochondrial [Pseudocercospora fuligena]|uniref:Large ribosomal subunit protein bL32m n=1 Tax=Pseudocercospora fuligena TaxID=685502 RepID=A0A8H6VPZ9_9PEZI|nr:putative 54S ribosomal protein L32, mitochondrial [Pseudocercospora fuligena]